MTALYMVVQAKANSRAVNYREVIFQALPQQKKATKAAFSVDILKKNAYWLLFPGFTYPSLASRLNVAWGTALRRALSMSLPVTLHIP